MSQTTGLKSVSERQTVSERLDEFERIVLQMQLGLDAAWLLVVLVTIYVLWKLLGGV